MSFTYQNDEPPAEQSPEDEGSVTRPAVSAVPWYSIILIASYSAVFVAQLVSGFDRSAMLAGDDKDAVLQRHEIWRMLTGAALHASVIHYAMNSYAFYSFGRIFEMLSNRAHVAIVFLTSAIAGSILSMVVNPHGISVGASGGIVGMVGYLAVYSFKRRALISAQFRNNLILNIGIILFYGFVLAQNVDNAGHIGGLVCGAAYALVQVPSDSYADPRIAGPVLETAGLAALGVFITVCTFSILLILQIV